MQIIPIEVRVKRAALEAADDIKKEAEMASKLLKKIFWLCITSHGFTVGLEALSRQPEVAAVVLQQNTIVEVKYCAEVLQI